MERFITNFAKGALDEIELKEKDLEEKYQEYIKTRHLKEEDLRLLFLNRIRNVCNGQFIDFIIDDKYYTIEQISKDDKLFNKLISESKISYRIKDYS